MKTLSDVPQTSISKPGVRLMAVEVRNWGTFDGRVERFDLAGGNALLTGQNGAGKSTLIDAMTTLLVPAQRINYNKAALADRDERDLRSYVLGTYRNERSSTGTAKPVSLRLPKSAYAVILGQFRNAAFDETVTLAQVFHFKEPTGQPARFYVVAEDTLTIKEHFSGFKGDIAALRRRLKREGADLYDSYPQYGADFRRRFGIASEQAINLFLQTVSMKTVGDLTGFVREHMLEPFPVEERIRDMIRHFDDLDRAHKEVLRARDQIERLTPIVADCAAYESAAREATQVAAARDTVQPFMAGHVSTLVAARIDTLDQDIARLAARRDALMAQEREADALVQSLARDVDLNGGDRLRQIAYETAEKVKVRDDRRRRAEQLRIEAERVGFSVPKSPERFADLTGEAKRRLASIVDDDAKIANARMEQEFKLRDLREKHAALDVEITSLRQRRSNLPQTMIELRDRLCGALRLDATTLPFAGELIEVRKDASAWEGAAERLLHGFALTLLVPERHYESVAGWVDGNHLAARLVYFKVSENVPALRQSRSKDALSEKLRLKEDTPLYAWLQREVDSRFDHICCASLEQFRRVSKGITRQGQIKGKGERHEKDDRHRLDDRTRYVLGWSNQEKIAALVADAKALEKPTQDVASAVVRLQSEARALGEMRGALERLTAFQSFADIDWASVARDIDRLEAERKAIAEGSDKLQALQKRHDEAAAERASLREKMDRATREEGELAEKRKQLCARREAAMDIVASANRDRLVGVRDLHEAALVDVLGPNRLTLENCDAREREMRAAFEKRHAAITTKQMSLGGRISGAMRAFAIAYPLECRDLDDNIDAADDFRCMLAELESDGLPRFEETFKDLLNENTINEIASFQSKLSEERRTIDERIETINGSLAGIDYDNGTYIAIEATQALDHEIKEFQQDLRRCTENTLAGGADGNYSEAKFIEVQRVIERLRGREGKFDLDQRWRRKVTDVRNWFEFAVSERFKSDHEEKEHYSDSSGKSGGQKEKLAYTILAASLAYQFKLEPSAERSRSFHFVMIDEAFSKASDEATRFGLSLFEKMGLQLLIATPLQKIHVIEPHVVAVGFVHNEDGKRSFLRTMTIEEYRAEKARSKRATALLAAAS